MKTGDKLRNGAICIAHSGRTMLAGWNDQYVTWRCDEDRNCYLGHYFVSLTDAVADYDKRCEEDRSWTQAQEMMAEEAADKIKRRKK